MLSVDRLRGAPIGHCLVFWVNVASAPDDLRVVQRLAFARACPLDWAPVVSSADPVDFDLFSEMFPNG